MKDQPISEDTFPPVTSPMTKINRVLIFIILLLLLIIVGGVAYLMNNNKSEKNQVSQLLPTPNLLKPTTPPTIGIINSPAPDQQKSLTPESRLKIAYAPVSSWVTFESELGFSFQYPPEYARFHKNPVSYKSDEPSYCQFEAYNNQSGESIRITVLPYSGGSRRQMVIERAALAKNPLTDIQEASLSNSIKGLIMKNQGEYPTIPNNIFAGIFIANNNALIITNFRREDDYDAWLKILQTLQIKNNLNVDTSKCQNDW